MNVADVLAKAGHLVDTSGVKDGRRLWEITESGEQAIRETLGLSAPDPEIEHDASSLMTTAAELSDPVTRDFIEEGIRCLQVGALRAAVVFIWSAAVRQVQERILDSRDHQAIADSFQRHDPRARIPSKIEDFGYVKDKTTLLVARDVGALDKGQKDTLEEALSLRNRCGHPTKYKPRANRVFGFIEDVVGIVFD